MILVLLFVRFNAHALQCLELFRSENSPQYTYQDSSPAIENLKAFAQSRNLQLNLDEKWLNHPITRMPRNLQGYSGTGLIEVDGKFTANWTFRIREKSGENAPEEVPVYKTKMMFSSPFPHQEVLGETWTDENQKFRFMNIGSRQLLHGNNPEDVISLVMAEAQKHPGMDIQVPINPEWAIMKKVLNDRQIYASTKGIRNYIERKPYLDSEDLYTLREHDLLNKQENDFLVLLKDAEKHPLEMSSEEFEKNLALMIRIARFNPNESPFIGLVVDGFGLNPSLPFFQRVPPDLQKPLQSFLLQLTNKKNLRFAELSRYNKFQELSEAIQDKFLARMFEMARQKEYPIDFFLLECDRFTSRLFARYGFKKLVRLTPNGNNSPEYLMYLDTHSQEYLDVVARLNGNSSHIQVQAQQTVPPFQRWFYNWAPPSSFRDASRFQKREQMEKVLEKYKNEVPQNKFFLQQMHDLATSIRLKDTVFVTGDASDLILRILQDYIPSQSVKLLQNANGDQANKVVIAQWSESTNSVIENQYAQVYNSLKDGGKMLQIQIHEGGENYRRPFSTPKDQLKP